MVTCSLEALKESSNKKSENKKGNSRDVKQSTYRKGEQEIKRSK